jgi:hypothetical protein
MLLSSFLRKALTCPIIFCSSGAPARAPDDPVAVAETLEPLTEEETPAELEEQLTRLELAR